MVPDGTMVEGVLRSSKLSLRRTRPEKERISKKGTSGEDSAVANSIAVRADALANRAQLPQCTIAGSNPRGASNALNNRDARPGVQATGPLVPAQRCGG